MRLTSTRKKLQSIGRKGQTNTNNTDGGDRSVDAMLDEDMQHQRDPPNNSIDSIDDDDEEEIDDLIDHEQCNGSEVEPEEIDLFDECGSRRTVPISKKDGIVRVSKIEEEKDESIESENSRRRKKPMVINNTY